MGHILKCHDIVKTDFVWGENCNLYDEQGRRLFRKVFAPTPLAIPANTAVKTVKALMHWEVSRAVALAALDTPLARLAPAEARAVSRARIAMITTNRTNRIRVINRLYKKTKNSSRMGLRKLP